MIELEIEEYVSQYVIGNLQQISFIKLFEDQLCIMNRSIWSDDSKEPLEIIDALKWSNELLHRLHNSRKKLENYVSKKEFGRILENVKYSSIQSKLLANHLTPTLKYSWERFKNIEKKYEFELDIESDKRFLILTSKVDSHPQTRHRTQNGKSHEINNLYMNVVVNYCYANIELPKCYEIIFDIKNKSNFWESKVIIHTSENSRKIHWDLWRGHSALCQIEFINSIPPIIDELPFNDGGMTQHRGIGLCSKYDWRNINREWNN